MDEWVASINMCIRSTDIASEREAAVTATLAACPMYGMRTQAKLFIAEWAFTFRHTRANTHAGLGSGPAEYLLPVRAFGQPQPAYVFHATLRFFPVIGMICLPFPCCSTPNPHTHTHTHYIHHIDFRSLQP